MLGDSAANRNSGASAAVAAPMIPPSNPSGSRRGQTAQQQNGSVIALLVLFAFLVLWAVIEQHQKVRDTLKPQNIALNLLNVTKIALAAVVGIVLGKVVLFKLAAMKIPFVEYIARVWGAA